MSALYDEEEGALPLLDTELEEPGMRDYVNSLILAEMEEMAAEGQDEVAYAARLPALPPSVLSAAQAAEVERVAGSGAVRPPGASLAALQLPQPPPPAPSDAAAAAAAAAAASSAPSAAWLASAQGAAVALESQGLCSLNLELACRYGPEAWRAAVGDSASLVAHVRAGVEALAAEVQAVAAGRMAAQEAAVVRIAAQGKRLRELQHSSLALAAALADGGSAQEAAAGRSVRGRAQ